MQRNGLIGKLVLAMLCICVFSGSALAEDVPAQTPAEATMSVGAGGGPRDLAVRLFSEPQSIKLPRAVTSYWFMVPQGTDIAHVSLHLEMESTDTMLEDYSTLTLELNGESIASANLVQLKRGGNVWEISIPVDYVKCDGSYNELRILSAQRSILGECADIDNPANWLILKDTSELRMQINRMGPCTLSTLLPYMFDRVDAGDRLAAEFVLDGGQRRAEIGSMLSVASSIGASYPYRNRIDMPVSQGSARTALENQILISGDAKGVNGIPKLKVGNGYLRVTESDGKNVAFIVGDSAEGLELAARVVLYSDYLAQLTGTEKEIQSKVTHGVADLALAEDHMYTLRDFGYSDISLAGAFHQQTNLQIRQPEGMMGGPDSYFEVHFRHSDALVSDTSLLTVLFNGVAASSIQLSRANAENGVLRVAIPQEAMKSSTISVTIDVYNYLGKIDCSKDWYDVAWTVIGADSVVYFQPTETVLAPSLESFPYLPPTVSGDEHQVLFCMPDDASETLLSAAAQLAARAGQRAQSPLFCRQSRSIRKDEMANTDIFIMGAEDSVVIPEEIAEKLYVMPGGGGFRIREEIDTIPEALEDRLIIQAVSSPYDFTRRVYVLLWPEDFEEEDVLALLSDKAYLDSLSGQLAFSSLEAGGGMLETGALTEITARGGANEKAASNVTLVARSVMMQSRPVTLDSIINTVVNRTGISRFGLLLILIFILILIGFVIHNSRVKNRFDKARSKVARDNRRRSKPAADGEDDEEDDFMPEYEGKKKDADDD